MEIYLKMVFVVKVCPSCHKNKKKCKKFVDNYGHALEFVLHFYKDQKHM